MTEDVQEERRAPNDSRERKPVAPKKVTTVVKKPSLGQKWREVQLSKTKFFWILVAGIALTMIVGFNWGGWVSGGTAQKMADTAAMNAVVLRLAPICVAQFNLDPEKDQKLAELQGTSSSYQRGDYVQKQGWATMAGEDEPDRGVAAACAELLIGS